MPGPPLRRPSSAGRVVSAQPEEKAQAQETGWVAGVLDTVTMAGMELRAAAQARQFGSLWARKPQRATAARWR